jgi:hypothetical protein
MPSLGRETGGRIFSNLSPLPERDKQIALFTFGRICAHDGDKS